MAGLLNNGADPLWTQVHTGPKEGYIRGTVRYPFDRGSLTYSSVHAIRECFSPRLSLSLSPPERKSLNNVTERLPLPLTVNGHAA